ncbi:MAG: polysulfide reductase NrfD [Polyangiaceae bacterium]|jgi:molybdopterin-containing oxidoreductase family membrane subunit|nr:polysulfide reductase NrfD [Polyangiaceae bacterium]
MQATAPPSAPSSAGPDAVLSYPRFLLRMWRLAFSGGPLYYATMAALTAIALVGANAWAHQLRDGMARTNLSDHVSWGLYIANFTFVVGLAAGAVMMVIPAYLYDDDEMHDVVIVGELLAVAAIVVCVGFIVVDMGRPDRMWHVVPLVGRLNWPISMLSWDVLVLNGYLLLNLHICGYLSYMKYLRRRPRRRWYLPFIFVSIGWAISIHSVTAFLYAGLGGRPFWNSALLAPRFIASAFITGPAFVIGLLHALRRLVPGFPHTSGPIRLLTRVLRVTILVNLFMFASEMFTELYAGGAHHASARYLFFGLHGKRALVPWAWTGVALNLASALLLHLPASRADRRVLLAGCACAFSGVWIEKGMGLIIPGFVPSTLHEVVEYAPSLTEWKVSAGIYAAGLMALIVLLRTTLPVFTGEVSVVARSLPRPARPPAPDVFGR